MTDNESSVSIVEYMGGHEGYRCGYCKSSDTCYSAGMWCHILTVHDYQNLIDRGWRRSGKYCYKPIMNKTCCPQYTIRCDSREVILSKSQKKLLKRVKNYLAFGKEIGNCKQSISEDTSQSNFDGDYCMPFVFEEPQAKVHNDLSDTSLLDYTERVHPISRTKVKEVKVNSECKSTVKDEDVSLNPKKVTKPGIGADMSKPPCRKAKQLRRDRYMLKKRLKNEDDTMDVVLQHKKSKPKTLEELLAVDCENPAHKLEVQLVQSHPPCDRFNETFDSEYSIYKAYQMAVHHDKPEKCSISQFRRFLCTSPLQLTLVPVRPNDVNFKAYIQASHKLFTKYQMFVHKETEEECNMSSYRNFLIDSPLLMHKTIHGLPHGYGSFHQQYWLDDKLIAVGVIDILPYCVSSVYLFYDPEYSFLSLGRYSALREIALTRQINKCTEELSWYYMGFYIHSCPKMRYKGQYFPSSLLCPETYTWMPISVSAPKLDVTNYSRLNEDTSLVDFRGQINIAKVLCLFNRRPMLYENYRLYSEGPDDEEVKEYATLVGSVCAYSMLLYRDL